MKIEDGLIMLEVAASSFGNPRVIYPALLVDGDHVILVDTGYPGQLASIRKAVEGEGVAFERIDQVILTHHDIDHIGGLASLRRELARPVTVMAHSVEKAYIEGEKTPLKLARLEANPAAQTAEQKAFLRQLQTAFQNSFSRVDETLADGQILPYCGGVRLIHTPGHTLGHMCLYFERIKALIAGDALTIRQGELAMLDPALNYDTELCRQSLRKLAQLDIDLVITYHGGLYRGDAARRIGALSEEREPGP